MFTSVKIFVLVVSVLSSATAQNSKISYFGLRKKIITKSVSFHKISEEIVEVTAVLQRNSVLVCMSRAKLVRRMAEIVVTM